MAFDLDGLLMLGLACRTGLHAALSKDLYSILLLQCHCALQIFYRWRCHTKCGFPDSVKFTKPCRAPQQYSLSSLLALRLPETAHRSGRHLQ